MMMNKTIISALALVGIACAPTHAIPDPSCAQLQRSGCATPGANEACDISKTTAEHGRKLTKPTVKTV